VWWATLRGRILTIGCHSERSEESVIDSSVAEFILSQILCRFAPQDDSGEGLPQNDRGRRAQDDKRMSYLIVVHPS
jgi:hypothetical protein